MLSPETHGTTEPDKNWKAPQEKGVSLEVHGKEAIEYSLDLNFRSADGNFDVLPANDRIITDKDTAQGIFSRQDKTNASFARLLGGLPAQLNDPSQEMPTERRMIVESLQARKPTFVELDPSKIDSDLTRASEAFPGSKPGVILFPERGDIINQFSAIEYMDGRIARVLRGKNKGDLDDFVRRANQLTPRMEAKQLGETTSAFAVEFIRDGERPKTITQAELDNWTTRIKESGLTFDFDVSEDDDSLDNFVRSEGKLYWVDGNILRAQPAQNEEDLNTFVEKQKHILSVFLEDKNL